MTWQTKFKPHIRNCTMKITTTFFHRQLLVGLFFPVPGTLQKYWRPYRKAPFIFLRPWLGLGPYGNIVPPKEI